MPQKIASLYAEIGADTRGLEKGLQQTRQGLQGAGKDADTLGEKVGKFATGFGKFALTAGVTALGGALVQAVKSASELETEFAKIAALTDTPREAIQGLTKDVMAMSREMPISAKELAKGLYFISSSGFQGAQAMDILRASAKAASAGLGETKTIADAVTSALNAYKLEGADAARITDILTQAVKEGKGEPDELAGSLGRVLPIASAAGVSMEQVAASMATMTRTGLTADEAATALRGTIGALLAPSKQAKDALGAIGLSVDDLAKMLRERGLVEVLQTLMERTHGNVEALDAIIPNVRALTGVLSTAGSQGEAYAEILGKMKNAAGSTDKAFAEMSNTFEFKSKKAQNSLENLGIAVGQKLLPPLGDAADAAAVLINWQDKVDEAFAGTKKIIERTAKSYEEYRDSILATAIAAGKMNEQEAEQIRTGKTLAETTFDLSTLTQDQAEAFNAEMMKSAALTGNYKDLAELTAILADRFGLMSEAQFAAAKTQEKLNDMAAFSATVHAASAESIEAEAKALEFSAIETEKDAKAKKELLEVVAESKIAYSDFVESITTANGGVKFDALDGAQQTIARLEQTMMENPENAENYASKIRAIKEQFGLISGPAEAAAASFRVLEEMWITRNISTTGYATALGKIQQAAKDGKVEVDELGLKTGEAAAYMTAATGNANTASDDIVRTGKKTKQDLLDEMGNSLEGQQTKLSGTISSSMISISTAVSTAKSVIKTGVGEINGALDTIPRIIDIEVRLRTPANLPGGGGAGGGLPNSYSRGANFIVPPGFTGDNYPLGYAKSGEHVIILNEQQQQAINNQMTMNVYAQSAPNVIDEFNLMRSMVGA
jgi:TP901 family phage tail tape measure protein